MCGETLSVALGLDDRSLCVRCAELTQISQAGRVRL
jgi:hypothetical protein